MALAVSQAENGTRECDRTHVNKDGTVDYGIFMINGYWHRYKATPEQLKDCITNIKVAYQIYKSSDWNLWSAYKNGSYRKFLR